MNVTVSNVLTIENPTQDALVWCKRNLVITNPEYAKKARMHFWLGNTPPTLTLYERRGDTLILPFGTLRNLPDCIAQESTFRSAFSDPVSVSYGGVDIPLYDYQRPLWTHCTPRNTVSCKARRVAENADGDCSCEAFRKRALWLTHTLDLLRQSKTRAELYMDSDLIGTITEGKVNIGKGITFATIQTMCKLDLTQYRDFSM